MKRFSYFLIFCSLMAVEVCIALFVHDSFIRPYVGDMLVTLLLCCMARWSFLTKCACCRCMFFCLLPAWRSDNTSM